ncbi:hypothetical protein AY600_01045 [Phormidium willei BDU 130791]|nr:hypothetical protein AY600_01045 [Phormidium willei BDU 130791]
MEKHQDIPKTLQPHHLETYVSLAESLSNQGRLTEAIQLYQSALILSPYTKTIRQKLQQLQDLEPRPTACMPGRQLSLQEMDKYLDLFRRDGFVVIPEYYPRQDCERLRHDLEGLLSAYHQDIDFKDGSYIRHPSENQQRKADSGVSRIYHIDKKIKKLQSLRYDDSIMRLITLYTGKPFYSGVLWYQYNRSQEDTRYFHVDIFGLQQQIKSIAYLEDVPLEKGPFCYIKGSHLDINLIRRRYESTQPPGQDSGYMEEEIRPILQNSVPVCGSAGSLIIADVGGAHRGLPQNQSRSILMQSFYSRPGDLPIGV